MKTIIELKYVAYVTTEIDGEVDYLDGDVTFPEYAVLVNGERVELNTSDSLGMECIESVNIIKPEEEE